MRGTQVPCRGGCGLRAAGCGLRAAGCGLRGASREPRAESREVRGGRAGPRAMGRKPRRARHARARATGGSVGGPRKRAPRRPPLGGPPYRLCNPARSVRAH
ncbi:hypothetical protein C6Q02_25615 [Burkholderia multivorans]|nr:hypothetical protein C6P91_27585 [Burkholderia multivorans]PRE75432.1 hypothetical protein C6Q02_25615 [Burkholderia multivorans]PRF72375.1 hypothetical protein C6Q12_23025 [Burkholderia multivorans]